MRYGETITRALSISWRHKYLWLLALFAGEGVASVSGPTFSQPAGRGGSAGPTPSQVWSAVTAWVSAHVPLLVLCAVAVVVIGVAFLLLSAIADGALVRASAEHDRAQPFSLRRAWSGGLATFWPVLKVKLLAMVVGLVSVIVIGGLGVLAVVSALQGDTRMTLILASIAAVLLVFFIPIYIVFSVIILLMVRDVVLGGTTSVWAALRRTLALTERRLGRVALLWLLSIVLGLASGVAVGVAVFLLLGIVAGLLLIAYLAGGITVAVVAGIALGVPWFVVLGIASGAISAFISTFWTLGYRRLDLEPAPQVAPYPPAAA